MGQRGLALGRSPSARWLEPLGVLRGLTGKKVKQMQRTLLSLALLTAALLAVTAAGNAAAPSVTISVSRPSVVYGGSVSLSGKIAASSAGQTVNVLAEPSGASDFSALASATTTTGGHWTEDAKPTIETSYQATWMSATSSPVTVKVRP
jgi:hypothetical protein